MDLINPDHLKPLIDEALDKALAGLPETIKQALDGMKLDIQITIKRKES